MCYSRDSRLLILNVELRRAEFSAHTEGEREKGGRRRKEEKDEREEVDHERDLKTHRGGERMFPDRTENHDDIKTGSARKVQRLGKTTVNAGFYRPGLHPVE